MYQKPSDAKQAARARLAADVEALWRAQGREIPLLDHTANKTWQKDQEKHLVSQVLRPSRNMGGKTGYEVKLRRGQQFNRVKPSCSTN